MSATTKHLSLEKSHTVLSMMIFCGAFLGLYANPEFDLSAAAQGNAIGKSIWLVIFLPGLLFSVRLPKRTSRLLLFSEPFMFLLMSLAMASTFWSLVPGISLRRSLHLFMTFHYACYLAARYSWDELLSLTRWALRLGLLLSCVTVVLAPDLGIHSDNHSGLWRGLYNHKNIFGRVGALCFVLALVRRPGLAGRCRWRGFDLGLSSVVLVGSYSKTSLVMLAATVGLLAMVRLWERSRLSLKLFLLANATLAATLSAAALVLAASGLAAFNWNQFLTGRLTLWKTVLYLAQERPWLGYGYSAFFHEAAFGRWIMLIEGWEVPHAHNILLSLFSELGLFSWFLYLGTVVLLVVRVSRRWRGHAAFPLALLSFNLVGGLTETLCYPDTELASMLFMSVAVSCSGRGRQQFPKRSSLPSDPQSSDPQTTGTLP